MEIKKVKEGLFFKIGNSEELIPTEQIRSLGVNLLQHVYEEETQKYVNGITVRFKRVPGGGKFAADYSGTEKETLNLGKSIEGTLVDENGDSLFQR